MARKFFFQSIILLSIIGIISILCCYLVFRVITETATFDTDEADHANAALELTYTLQTGEVHTIIEAFRRQSFYPPIHSLTITPFYLLFGPSLATSRLPSVFLFMIYCLLFSFTLRSLLNAKAANLSGISSTAGFSFGLLVGCLSPILIFNSTLCMLETLGTLLMLAFLTYFTTIEAKPLRTKHLMTGVGFVLLMFLTKYSFGIFALGGYAVFLLSQLLQKRLKLRDCIMTAGATVLLLAAWLLFCDWHAALNFIFGQPKTEHQFLSAKNILFYPRTFLKVHTLRPWIGWMTLFSACIGAYRLIRLPAIQLAVSLFGVGLLVLTLSPENGSRHILPIMPALYLLAGLGFSIAMHESSRRIPQLHRAFEISIMFLFILLLTSATTRISKFPSALTRRFEAKPYYSEIFTHIASYSRQGPLLVEGTTDSLSLEGLRWWIARSNHTAYTTVAVDAFPFSSGTQERAIIHSRNQAAPWTNSVVPFEPLKATLKSGYYRTFIRIHGPTVQRRLNKKADDPQTQASEEYLDGLVTELQQFGDTQVEVFSIPAP